MNYLAPSLVATVEDSIAELVVTHGEVSPETIVDTAKDRKSPLHQVFEWDDNVAAQEHRLHQARQLIRTIVVRPKESRPSDRFRLVGTGGSIKITTKTVIVSRAAGKDPPLPPSFNSVMTSPTTKPSRITPSAFSPPASDSPLKILKLPDDSEITPKSVETSQKLLAEATILKEVKSRLIATSDAIDIARNLRVLIADLEDLAGRIGKVCSRCHLRNQTLGDGKHECSGLNNSSGTSNLGSAG
jgi:hypothetical protein